MSMKKPFYQCTLTIVNALLCLSPTLYSCKTQTSEPKPMSERTIYYAPSALEKDETLVPTPSLSEFWPTEDVDISMLDKSKKHVAFTFDDAPTRHLPELTNVFLEFNKNNPDCVASAKKPSRLVTPHGASLLADCL